MIGTIVTPDDDTGRAGGGVGSVGRDTDVLKRGRVRNIQTIGLYGGVW